MKIIFTAEYLESVGRFMAHNETKLALKPLIRELHSRLRDLPPMDYGIGILHVDTHFTATGLDSIACLYARNPRSNAEIAPCFLYFPNDAAELSISRQGMKEQIAAVLARLGWR